MTALAPLETLLDATDGCDLPLPPELAHLYGRVREPNVPQRLHVVGNFVATLDGVADIDCRAKIIDPVDCEKTKGQALR
jgi:hypothetical protein